MRFACDVMLGKLARYLRILGFDAAYAKSPAALARLLADEPDRMFLTRRSRHGGGCAFHVAPDIAAEQLRQLKPLIGPALIREALFSRCIECNVALVDAERTDVEPLVPEFVYHNYTRFRTCPACGRVYWEGSHKSAMEALVEEMFA